MKITIRYFASIREALNLNHETLETQAQNLGELREELMNRGDLWRETLSHERSVRMAFNHEISDEKTLLSNNAEIAFFPPVTGG